MIDKRLLESRVIRKAVKRGSEGGGWKSALHPYRCSVTRWPPTLQNTHVEVHHVRKLADVRRKYKGRRQPPQWVVFMMSRNRKTIVVCRDCHHKIHAGTYDGPKLN